jgi:hypothetical protein
MKTYPAKWSTAQAAYFSGLLSARILSDWDISVDQLDRIVGECSYIHNGEKEIRFTELIARLEPRISENSWYGIVGRCERLFK